MNDGLYKALSKGYADEVEQLNALELIETQQNSIMHRNDLLAELARNVEGLQAEVERLREALKWYGVQVHTFATDQTGKADKADVVLDLDRGSRARAALEYGETDQ